MRISDWSSDVCSSDLFRKKPGRKQMGAGERRRRKPEELRSHRWFGVDDLRSFGHRSRSYQIGFAREDFAGKPVIGIINTWKIGRAHVCTPVTNAHLVCRLLLEKKNIKKYNTTHWKT